jgi:hypothetical protein
MMAAVNACRQEDMTAMYRTTADALAWLRAGFDQSARYGEDFSFDKRWSLLTRVGCLALDEMTAFYGVSCAHGTAISGQPCSRGAR